MNQERFNNVVVEVQTELERALEKFRYWPIDIIHQASVVGEEAGELTKAVCEYTYEPSKETLEGVRKEAIQVAAMAIRFIANIDNAVAVQSRQEVDLLID